jgi:nucleoside-diphosphate-sugar epimerase
MRYAVTGATGFVGGALVRLLRANGHDVLALVRSPARATALAAAGVTLVEGDLDDATALDRLGAGAGGLFHVAGWYKLGDARPEDGWRVNVDGTANVLAAAHRSGMPKVVYTSTLAVNSDTHGRVVDESYQFTGRHLSVYDETKARAHDVATEAARDGVPVVIVQPGLVYGPGDTSQTGTLVAAVLAGRRPTVPAGGAVCWGYVDDIARGHLLAMEQGTPGESYFLAGEPCALADGLRLLAELAGKPGPIVLSASVVRVAGAAVGVVERVIRLPAGYSSEAMRASLATYLGNPAKAYRELGWTSRPLRQGLSELVTAG